MILTQRLLNTIEHLLYCKAFFCVKNIYSYFLNADEIERTERMRKRGDSEEEIHKRIYHDRFKFDTSLNKYIDKFIDEDNKTTDEIAKEIYDDYISRIK